MLFKEKARYFNGYRKVYLFRFEDKKTGQFVALKPGHTDYMDAEDRARVNHEKFLEGKEPDSFMNHYKVKCIWSLRVDSHDKADMLEDFMLAWFGEQKKLDFKTSGYTEVRNYNQKKVNKWKSKSVDKIQNWLNEEIHSYRSSIQA